MFHGGMAGFEFFFGGITGYAIFFGGIAGSRTPPQGPLTVVAISTG